MSNIYMDDNEKLYYKNNAKVRLLPISIILFIIVFIFAIYIILNKGKIGNYSLIKSESTVSDKIVKKYNENDKIEIKAEKKFLAYKSNETEKIEVLINDEKIDKSEISFESSNEDVLKIDDQGIVTAVSLGKATVTAKVEDLSATFDIRTIIPISSISFTSTNSTVRVGGTLQMKLIAKPSGANIETLKYTSSDEEIATVNSNGIVTGIKAGKVTITVTDLYTETSKSVNLVIK